MQQLHPGIDEAPKLVQDSDDGETEEYSMETGGASRGSGGRSRGGRKRKASPKERKPAMPQFAVKRRELTEGWNDDIESEGSEDFDEENMMYDDGGCSPYGS